jgi:hypothetical protein
MKTYLVNFKNETSEFFYSFESVQNFMNILEKQGIVSNIKVQMFVNNKLEKEITYDYDGEKWVKI